ncbi:MAG: hypothetical protein ACI4TU_10955 [Candidatus Cryptobacteroides sp.]
MKKRIIIAVSALVLTTAAIVALCSFTSVSRNLAEMEAAPTCVDCQGDHCSGSVGCDCSGFKAITDGEVWQESYCKKCGHHKRYHK